MTAGLEDFGRWLCDLVRAGTAAARQQPYSWWDATAARLVDAQLPGLAEQVRDMGSEIHRRDDWAEHLLSVSGRWWTATRTWSSRDALDRDAMADLRAFLGWAQPSADIKAADSVTGSYLVLGGHRTDDGRLLQQRTWLRDESTGETLVVLDFSAGLTPLATPQLAGTVVSTTVSRYPGTPPRRALFAADPVVTGTTGALPGAVTIAAAQSARAERLAATPFSDRVPVVLGEVVVTVTARPSVADADGDRLDLVDDDGSLWSVLAMTGGQPADMFGELSGGRFRPLSVAVDGGLVAL